MLDFDLNVHRVITIGSIDIWITDTTFSMAGIMLILIIFAVVVRIKLSKFKEIPTGFQNFVELIVEMFENFVAGSAGAKLSWVGGWFFTVFSFLLLSNMSGVVWFVRPPTADWTVPLSLAIITVVLMQAVGVWYRGWDYISKFFKPFFLFLPINILGELSRPISLSFRLFGNVLGGMILVSLVYALTPTVVAMFLPVVLHAYFDVISGAMQAFVFTVLSLTYLGLAVSED
ncbi:MAG: F0F1 ATP synthase subunit A [Defluviitaleaceae bacterium]|nr:F0F1 ATP synthase subunit A [Defluviitaleaceae bacterium]